MPRLYAVIGDAGVGKGSVIRHLSGVSKANNQHPCYLTTMHQQTIISAHIQVSSLQEGALPHQRYSPTDFITHVNGLPYTPTDVLVPLRLVGIHGLPDWNQYIHDFQQTGWQIAGLEFLGSALHPRAASWPHISHLQPAVNSLGAQPTSNRLALNIRAQWGWE